MKYSKDQINDILNLRHSDGSIIDVFQLCGQLYVGNREGITQDLTKYTLYTGNGLRIDHKDFEWCDDENDVVLQFRESMKQAVYDQLLSW